jgi:hypothetical protein
MTLFSTALLAVAALHDRLSYSVLVNTANTAARPRAYEYKFDLRSRNLSVVTQKVNADRDHVTAKCRRRQRIAIVGPRRHVIASLCLLRSILIENCISQFHTVENISYSPSLPPLPSL